MLTPVPAMMLVTPVFNMFSIPWVAFAVSAIPVFAMKVLYGLAQEASVEKLFCVLLNATNNESLPTDSLGKPIFMF
jgi:hypothetical protein